MRGSTYSLPEAKVADTSSIDQFFGQYYIVWRSEGRHVFGRESGCLKRRMRIVVARMCMRARGMLAGKRERQGWNGCIYDEESIGGRGREGVCIVSTGLRAERGPKDSTRDFVDPFRNGRLRSINHISCA